MEESTSRENRGKGKTGKEKGARTAAQGSKEQQEVIGYAKGGEMTARRAMTWREGREVTGI